MKKKLLVLLGAGSSASNRLPGVKDLDGFLKGLSKRWTTPPEAENYFEALWLAVDRHYAAEPKPLTRRKTNFETVLAEMVALANWVMPTPHGTSFRETACRGGLPPGLRFPLDHLFAQSGAVYSQLVFLLDGLAKYMRAESHRIDPRSREFVRYSELFRELSDRFDVGIYNLNYDALAVTAAPDLFTGFNAGTFDPRVVHDRNGWDFIYHLHGSVHHTLVGSFGDEIRWQSDLGAKFDDGEYGRSTDPRSDGRSFPKTTLIAGGFKLDQLLVEPFQSFYSSFVRHVSEADAILIGGYGFGDAHVNRVFRNRLAATARTRPPVMVLSFADEDTDPMQFRADVWSQELCRTLTVSADSFSEPGHSAPPAIHELVASQGFEVAEKSSVAIWHGGFVEAVIRVRAICDWLERRRPSSILAGCA